jgi:UPF0755 protein
MRSFFSKRNLYIFLLSVLVLLTAFVGTVAVLATPPKSYPTDSIISVKSGSGLYQLSNRLEDEGVIRSSLMFRTAAIMLGGERSMRAGEYYLSGPENVFILARRMVMGDYKIATSRITIPEGFTVRKISALFGDDFAFFDNEAFEASAPEGYLFPDTYFIPVSATATSTVKVLRDNFIRKIFPLMPEVERSGRSLDEIITMASIIESEANNQKDREIVSGILWRRFDAGMPLQVDASFIYVNGKTTFDLTLEDLKIKSPYNTYVNKGLPPTPISNPGLDSIKAALAPTSTPYVYFLTGRDGTMYYARTHDEHVRNKQRFLRN